MDTKKLLRTILDLPSRTRADMAGALIDSLDDSIDDDGDLIAEAKRREQAVEEGSARYLGESEFREGIRPR